MDSLRENWLALALIVLFVSAWSYAIAVPHYLGEAFITDWTALSLQNSWTASPDFSFRSTLITTRLAGVLTPPGVVIGNQLIATLPAGSCPDRTTQVTVGMGTGTSNLTVSTDCTIRYSGVTIGLIPINTGGASWFNATQ